MQTQFEREPANCMAGLAVKHADQADGRDSGKGCPKVNSRSARSLADATSAGANKVEDPSGGGRGGDDLSAGKARLLELEFFHKCQNVARLSTGLQDKNDANPSADCDPQAGRVEIV